MNGIIKSIAVVLLTLATMACEKISQTETKIPLEVNTNNISGKWQLVEWNGETLTEGTYVYLDIIRQDRTYTMYQNMDSFFNVSHVVTGSYVLYTEPTQGAIIRGTYDHDSGDWAHRYIVKALYADEMLWVATDDPTFTQTYIRVESIPVK